MLRGLPTLVVVAALFQAGACSSSADFRRLGDGIGAAAGGIGDDGGDAAVPESGGGTAGEAAEPTGAGGAAAAPAGGASGDGDDIGGVGADTGNGGAAGGQPGGEGGTAMTGGAPGSGGAAGTGLLDGGASETGGTIGTDGTIGTGGSGGARPASGTGGAGGPALGAGGSSAGRGGGGAAGGGGGTGNVGGTSLATTGPCANLCAGPISVKAKDMVVLGMGATCHELVGAATEVVCGNFIAPRTFTVNGATAFACTSGGSNYTLPNARKGGFCLQASAGNQPWAYFQLY
jgi:hypothetical protein